LPIISLLIQTVPKRQWNKTRRWVVLNPDRQELTALFMDTIIDRRYDMEAADQRDAWVLRAGAELWKAVAAEGKPAQDTREALQAVRLALDCARRLRCAGEVSDARRRVLELACAQAEAAQIQALRRWCLGRGLSAGRDWGEQWGETL